MRDAVFFGEAASVYQPAFRFHLSQSETEINSGLRRGFDLSEDMVAIQGNYGLARTGLDVSADLETDFQESIIDWAQAGLPAREHCFNVSLSGLEIFIRIELFTLSKKCALIPYW